MVAPSTPGAVLRAPSIWLTHAEQYNPVTFSRKDAPPRVETGGAHRLDQPSHGNKLRVVLHVYAPAPDVGVRLSHAGYVQERLLQSRSAGTPALRAGQRQLDARRSGRLTGDARRRRGRHLFICISDHRVLSQALPHIPGLHVPLGVRVEPLYAAWRAEVEVQPLAAAMGVGVPAPHQHPANRVHAWVECRAWPDLLHPVLLYGTRGSSFGESLAPGPEASLNRS